MIEQDHISSDRPDSGVVSAFLSGIQLPLANAEYAIEQHLSESAVWIDSDTRLLLARLRDLIGGVATSARKIVPRTPPG